MKKVKVLIAVLVCSVMMMGVGYAWWNDSITVATTANTGNMNMEFTAESSIAEQSGSIVSSFEYGTITESTPVTKKKWVWIRWPFHGEFQNVTTNNTTTHTNYKELTCTLNNLYPGAYVDLEIPVKNVGSIPVKLKDVTLTSVGGDDIGDLESTLLWATTNYLQIDPQETQTFKVRVSVKDEAEYDNETQSSTATFNVNFNWKQFNN